jgi:hypothetical protein
MGGQLQDLPQFRLEYIGDVVAHEGGVIEETLFDQ